MVEWEDGQLVKGAYVEIEGKEIPVNPAQYNGKTPISAKNLKKMQKDLTLHKYRLDIKETVKDNSELEIPCYYQVGNDSLTVFLNGERLIKATDEQDGSYKEVGSSGTTSSKIQIYEWGCTADPGDVFEFIVKGVYS